jgi:hypothetical protein
MAQMSTLSAGATRGGYGTSGRISSPCLRGRALAASWICQLVAAGILGQTLFFKFTAAPESVYIFSRLGIEPWGRIGSGVAELIAAILLVIPATAWLGALLTMGVLAGAIGAHLTKLGIVVQDDGGLLFGLALVSFAAAAVVAILRRRQIPFLGNLL